MTPATAVDEILRPAVAPQVEYAVNELAAAGECWRIAVEGREQWAHEKPGEKVAAIKRLLGTVNELTGKPHSCSSAEAVVETDETYRAFLNRGTTLLLLVMQTETAYTIARLRAEHLARYI